MRTIEGKLSILESNCLRVDKLKANLKKTIDSTLKKQENKMNTNINKLN